MQSWIHRPPTYSISFTEVTCDHIVHIVILTQVQLQQIDLHLTVLDKHAMFNNLEERKKTFRSPIHKWKLKKIYLQ